MKFCLEGWPDRNQLQGPVRQYWQERAVLSVHDGLLLRGTRYIEIAQLNPTRSMDVIVHLKSMFARHGIPEILLSDNGPQFSGREMQIFAADYGFVHVTSSPRYAQSNGEAERAVQTSKNLLKKARDPYRALLAYRATPLSNGYSPAQLLMGRHLRTTVPTLSENLRPSLPDRVQIRHKEGEKRQMAVKHFNRRHRARDLSQLVPGDQVWISDTRAQGTVTSLHHSPRSYLISGPSGTLRRNRRHLVPIPVLQSHNEDQPVGPPEGDPSTGTRSETLFPEVKSHSTPSVTKAEK
ncbi:uncharacterized protein [Paramormyrops kingsleyae]|uniref:uncharacterized protein n=1 Tax=Paramormyrops kingsleyae TaxID=1676925 RepID=UPI003B979DBE